MALPPQYNVPPPMRGAPRDTATTTPQARAGSGTAERRSSRPSTSSSQPRTLAPDTGVNPLLAGKPLPATPEEEDGRRYPGPLPPPRHISSNNLASQYHLGEGSGSSAVPFHPSIRRSGSENSVRGPSTRRSSRTSTPDKSPPTSYRASQSPNHSALGDSTVRPISPIAPLTPEPPRSPPTSHPFLSGRESSASSASGSSPEKEERRRRRREKEEKDRQRLERRRRRAERAERMARGERARTPDPDRPTIGSTVSLLLLPFRLALMPFRAVLGPVVWHLVNTVVILLVLAGIGWAAVLYIRHALSGLPEGAMSTALIPLRAAATPMCLITGIGCEMSFLKGEALWGKARDKVDVAAVSRGLSKEARQAKDIFESLQALGDGRMTHGLGHVRIHELGIAISTGSSLEQREFVGQELVELADMASELTDEIVAINAMSVTTFSWLFWEFSSLVNMLSMPDGPSPVRIMSRLDSLLSRLDRDLDRLYGTIEDAIPISVRGAAKGWDLLHTLSSSHSELEEEAQRYPGWQRALDGAKRFFKGGDPSKLQRISKDLAITRDTIAGIDDTTKSLHRVALDLKTFRTQVRSFKGSVMGVHLGAEEEGLGPEMEMHILAGVVEELGNAVGRAKRRPTVEREMRIDPAPGQAMIDA